MEELCQPSLNGRGGPIASIAIQETNFGLKNEMIQQSIKVNGVTDDAFHLYLFPHSLAHHATTWFDRLPRNSINTFEQMAKMFLEKYFPPSMVTKLRNEITNFRQRLDESLSEAWECYKLSIDRCPNHNMLLVTQIDTFYNGLTLRHRDTINAAAGGTFMKRRPEECYDLIENMTAYHNDWDISAQWCESSSSITSSFDTEIAALKAEMAEINKNLMRVLQVNQQVKAVTPNYETCGGPHSFSDCPATVGQTQNVYAVGAYQGNSYQSQGNRNLLSYRSENYLEPPGFNQNQAVKFRTKIKTKIRTRIGIKETIILRGTTREETNSSRGLTKIPQPQVVTTNEFKNFMKANDAILKNMQTNMTSLTNSILELKNMFGQFIKMNTTSSSGLGTLPVERETKATKDTVHPTNNGSTEDVQPSVVPTESLTLNSEPVISPIIEPVASPVSDPRPNQRPLIPYPSRLQDQMLRDKANDQREKFFQIFNDLNFNISFADALILIPKFGPSINSLLTNKDKLSLADLSASINLMPLSVWNKLSLPNFSPTCMTLELVDRWISHPVRVAEDVYVKVGTFYFLADFIVVDFDADPRVPLILERFFLKTRRALIDLFEGELTLRVGKEAITFNLDQTSRYSANYNDMTVKQIDVIDMACEEYSHEVLGFYDVITSSNPTPYFDPIVSTTSSTLTPFKNIDFLLEEVDAFLSLEDDSTSPEVDQSYLDSEGDILILEAFLNDDPSLPPPNQGNYLPEDLPLHLEYVFLEGDDKLPVIIVKDLSMKEKTTLITVLKLHKRAIAWKLSDIKGIDTEFCTHKILKEEDFKPAVQHQRRVNPKIHDVIKQEVLKLFDAGLIYPIYDCPWVSPVYCVPKKGGFTIVENEENELIMTRLVTGWRVSIDYSGNQYYCFLDGFSGYFQIPIDPKDQEKTTFTCPYETFAYRRMPFGLCNTPGTFQRCMLAIFHDMIEKTMEEKSHFMVKEGIVLGHKISKEGIEVDKAKVDVITKLPHLITVKGIRSFLGHVGFYRRFIKDFLKIARPMTHLLEKDTPFIFSKECVEAFQTLKRKLTEAPILIAPDWDKPLELMYDASDFAIGAVLEQRQEKHFRPIHYASKTMTETESNYTIMEKEMLAMVYAFKKLRSYLIMNKSIMYTDHSALKYLFAKKDSKVRLLHWVLLLQKFTFKVIDTKGAENLAADHLS
nr:reverse transcriptase domain-containing protein [Tanacetum cinerariifolium]